MRCLCPPHEWFVTPAPPTYRYEDYPPYLEARAPIWTMGARTRYALVFHCNAHLSHYRQCLCITLPMESAPFFFPSTAYSVHSPPG